MQTEHVSLHRTNLYEILLDYVEQSNSQWGKEISDHFEDYISKFWLVLPTHHNVEMPLKNISEIA
jgi:glutamate synthase (NADPH/NADH) large chain